jgi:hypothetical protein
MCFFAVHTGSSIKRTSTYWLLLLGLATPLAVQAQHLPPPSNRAAVTLPARLTALDSANGFRQYSFGTRLNDWPTSVESLRTTKQGQVTLVLPAEPVIIGGLLLQGIRCHFYNGRLARLDFAATSEADTEELLRVLQSRYGTGQPAGVDQIAWTGQVVTLLYTLITTTRGHGQQIDITRQGQASLLSNALLAEMQAEQAANRRLRKVK